MELKETINLFEECFDKLNQLWRSLWPRKQKENNKRFRRWNIIT